MKIRDVMTRTVISATPDTSIPDAAVLLVDNRISALPVVDGGSLVGIVSEADLLRRYELGTERDPASRPWWRRLLGGDGSSWSYVESHAMKVRDIMTSPVVTVAEDMPASDAVALFESRRIKRAPVLRAGAVVGIVSRADFVRALATRAKMPRDDQPRSDESIRRALLAELDGQSWWQSRSCEVAVVEGIVHFSGLLYSADDQIAARVAAENIPGVRGVQDTRSVPIPVGGYL